MNKSIPSSSNGQAQMGAGSTSKSNQPLSFHHRPDAGRRGPDPLEYQHRHPSMAEYAKRLALRYHHSRTRQSYYRQLRLIADHFACDPATLTESQLRDYFLHVKTSKLWRPKTVRQAAACARLFFVDQLGHEDWSVFSQIHAKDQDRLPAVLTRDQVVQLLRHFRLRRYRIPIKLIYCCGLRLLPARLSLDPNALRAAWAITHCRTATMGGHLHACEDCEAKEFHFQSCNHRSCPQCGRADTAEWVRRQLDQRVGAPYFMVTFTLNGKGMEGGRRLLNTER